MVKNPPAVQETWVQSLGWEDPLEKGTATHPSILAWRIPWTEESGVQNEARKRLTELCQENTLVLFFASPSLTASNIINLISVLTIC